MAMREALYKEALDAYINPLHEFEVQPLEGGLINRSFKVISKETSEPLLLQQINKQVFPNPEEVQHNYINLWQYMEFEFKGFRMPAPMFFPDNQPLFQDSMGNHWRIFEFIEGSKTVSSASRSAQAKSVARLFGKFTRSLRSFNFRLLKTVIPGFHDLSSRFRQFKAVQELAEPERLLSAKNIIGELGQRERYVNFYDVIIESEEFPLRVMHHDAKISNVLFDEKSGKLVCPVDFDTAMPGYYFSDVGDMIRSMTSKYDENYKGKTKTHLRAPYYKAIIEGYLAEMKSELTASELKYIHFAGIALCYMQALRFLSDYLNGDTYYKVEYPGQNLDRSTNQFRLLVELEEFLKQEYKFSI